MNSTVLPANAVACDWRFAASSACSPLSLSADIERALRATRYSALRGVDIVVNSGVVFLTGRMPSYHMKQLGQATAMRMPGVFDVCNELDVACSRYFRDYGLQAMDLRKASDVGLDEEKFRISRDRRFLRYPERPESDGAGDSKWKSEAGFRGRSRRFHSSLRSVEAHRRGPSTMQLIGRDCAPRSAVTSGSAS